MRPLLDPTRSPRLAFLGRTLSVAIPMHLVWEIAQLPLCWEYRQERLVLHWLAHRERVRRAAHVGPVHPVMVVVLCFQLA